MNELLQQHGCSNVFTVPEGLKELMSDISREVLRLQPRSLLDFITNYLSALLITREHGIMAVKILDDLCDCRPSVSEHLLQLGLERTQAETLSEIIKTEIESSEPVPEKETVKEYDLMKKILTRVPLDEEMSAKVCQVARNAYKDYWYRRDLMKKGMKKAEDKPWEIAAANTLELYKKTKPTLTELHRATEKIQAAYKGYHIRRNVLSHLLPKKQKKYGRKLDLPGPPLDVGASREIDLGPVVNIRQNIKEDDVDQLFEEEKKKKLGSQYNPLKSITHEDAAVLDRKAKKGVKLGANFADETLTVDRSGYVETDKMSHPSAARISFSGAPEVIKLRDDGALPEVPEEKDEIMELSIPATDEDLDLEVPEDLTGEGYDDYTESGLSAPETANATDVEDIPEEGEEEEE